MGGFFGVASKDDCVTDLFYGTDYHSHLGTKRGGLAVRNGEGLNRFIHDISNAQFRSKFEHDIVKLHGHTGIGVISDYEDQPLIIGSHLGTYAIVTVGVVKNAEELTKKAFHKRTTHFSEMSGGEINPTELIATLINQEATSRTASESAEPIEARRSSCDRPRYLRRATGAEPLTIGRKDNAVRRHHGDAPSPI